MPAGAMISPIATRQLQRSLYAGQPEQDESMRAERTALPWHMDASSPAACGVPVRAAGLPEASAAHSPKRRALERHGALPKPMMPLLEHPVGRAWPQSEAMPGMSAAGCEPN
jgi:hypothetical protein